MKKTTFSFFNFFLILCAFAFHLSSCASAKIDTVEGEKEVETKKIEETWSGVDALSELYGNWVSQGGQKYEIPFTLNDRNFLLYSEAERDDTALWMKCAERHFTSIDDLWSKRFSYVSEVYGANYPIADSNGTQFGYKLFCKKNQFGKIEKITSRFDRLIPMEIVELNKEFFIISNSGKLKENGTFHFYSDRFSDARAENLVFSKFVDYWK